MDLDALLFHYFGTDDPEAIDTATRAEGDHRLAVDFGTEREPSRRFALWSLMEALGTAPPPSEAFEKHPALRKAAEDYLTLAWKLDRG
jgi:hypothetical protein